MLSPRLPTHRITAALLTIVLCGVCLGVTAPKAHATVSAIHNGITYTASDTDLAAGATVTSAQPDAGTDITIPDSVTIGAHSYPVTQIGASAFRKLALTSVAIPDTVHTIHAWAFAANRLTEVTIPNAVTSIGASAFRNNRLTAITIPDSVTEIGATAFQANLLTHVTLGAAVSVIGGQAFAKNQLTAVTIPDSVTLIKSRGFDENPQLASICFLGNAPAIASATALGSFGMADAKTLYHLPHATGFVSPMWKGYPTQLAPTIRFDSHGGTPEPAPQTALPCAPLSRPAPDPTLSNQDFTGWYLDAALATPYDFTVPLTTDATLHAGWQPQITVVPPAGGARPSTPTTPGTPPAVKSQPPAPIARSHPRHAPDTRQHAAELQHTGSSAEPLLTVTLIALAALMSVGGTLLLLRSKHSAKHRK